MATPGMSDYRDGTKKGEKKLASPNDTRVNGIERWWKTKGLNCAQAIGSSVDTLQKAQTARIRQQVINQSLYGNRRLSATQAQARLRLLAATPASNRLITYNAVQSIVDTVTSKIGENKPRPYFLTSGGNYKQQRKAKRLNKYVEGVFYEQKVYSKTPMAFRDSAIDGDGFLHVFGRGGKACVENVSGAELWVDEEEAQYGAPRTMYRCKVVDREELAGYFPEQRAVIEKATPARSGFRETTSEMLSVVETWHIGNLGPDGKRSGGFHAIALLGSTGHMLVEPEDWPHDFFPFAKLPWCAPPTGCGYWSQSLAEQLQGEQIELNKELQLIQRSMHLAGNLIVWTKFGSKLVKEHLTNEIGNVITSAEKPEFFCPDPIHPVFFENTNRIIERMERKAGLNEMSIAGKKPAGLDSGKALREAEDEQSDRHKTSQRQYDAFHLQLAEIIVALSIELAEQGELEAVRVPGRQSFDEVDFKADLKGLKRSEFTMQCYSVSRLPKEPSGRLQTIIEHIQAGIISLRQGRKLLDFPDLEAFETLADAQENIITKVLDAIVDDEGYEPPEPTDDLVLAKEMVVEYIQHYRALGLEDERLNDLRSWSLQVDELTAKALPAAAAPGMSPPQATPTPPPQSDMLPNAPQPQMAA